MLRNRLHFGQAEGTPFTQHPLHKDVEWAATLLTSDLILQGEYRVQEFDTPQCKELLAACKAKTELNSIPHEMTMADFRGEMKTWRESTTTSPFGRHLARYKALFTNIPIDPQEGPEKELSLSDKQEKIAEVKLAIINYCKRHMYVVLNRWKTIVNVMIFKDPGDYKIHRLRVIHIYEADFNALLAVKWRRHALLNDGQYGGRPGCEAQSLTLLEELKYDISYLSCRSRTNFDNDATSCYDRILVPLASLINRKYGLHKQVVAVHAHTLKQAQFHLKTAAGVSDLFYTHSTPFPIQGTGQGSGNSPCIWLFILSTLFDVHKAQAYGTRFITPHGQHQVIFSMVGFVDDSTGSCNDFQVPIHELLS